jgi:RHS repeat-associated protein
VLTTNVGTTTTYFVDTHYEVTDGVVTKYYYAGSQRIAMRKAGELFYILGDHLGSTSIVTSANGTKVSEMRYKAWGEVRYESGVSPTDYTYTGQYSDSYINLLWYNSRHYDPYLGRFTSPDSIVPTAVQGVQAYDRFAYVSNNPVRYNDPTGHCPMCIGAVIGGLVNAGLYIYTESRQPGGFDLHSDWKDLAVAAGTGAVAGALIGSGVGASAGAAMLASAAGVGMAGNIISDHAENVLTGEDFSAEEHVITSAAGAAQGLVAGQLTTVTTGTVQVGAQLLNAGVWGGLDETAQSGIDGTATLEDFGNGFVSNAVSQAFNLGMNKMISWDPDAGVWIDPPTGSRELIDVITPAFSTFGNWVVREEQRRWKNGYYEE